MSERLYVSQDVSGEIISDKPLPFAEAKVAAYTNADLFQTEITFVEIDGNGNKADEKLYISKGIIQNVGGTIASVYDEPLPFAEAKQTAYENADLILTELYLVEVDDDGKEIEINEKLQIVDI